jgi:hypothetical protein
VKVNGQSARTFAAGALLSIAAFVASAQTTTNADPIELFAKMMPVFSHPRCVNCHGGVNPYDIDASTPVADIDPTIRIEMDFGPGLVVHGGGATSAGEDCDDCHTDANRWHLAPRDLRFAGKTTKQLCDLQSAAVAQLGRGQYLGHLSGDALIGLAFAGKRGGASGHADRPGMSRDDFVQAAAEWIATGRASCGGWVGTITQTETFAANYGYPIQAGTGPSSMAVIESAKRVFALERIDGQVTVKIEQSGHNTTTGVIRDGLCTSTATSNSDWIGLNTSPAAGGVSIEIKPDGSYSIRMIGPKEKTSGDGSSDLVTDCGPLPTTHDTNVPIELDWDPWTFMIRCPPDFTPDKPRGESINCDLFDPERFPFLKGTMTRVIIESDADKRQSWLRVSPTGVSRSDTGEPLPVTIVTEWDFKIEE